MESLPHLAGRTGLMPFPRCQDSTRTAMACSCVRTFHADDRGVSRVQDYTLTTSSSSPTELGAANSSMQSKRKKWGPLSGQLREGGSKEGTTHKTMAYCSQTSFNILGALDHSTGTSNTPCAAHHKFQCCPIHGHEEDPELDLCLLLMRV